MAILEDKNAELSALEVFELSPVEYSVYQTSSRDTLMSRTSTFWGIFQLHNTGGRLFKGMLEVGGQDEVYLHTFDAFNAVTTKKGGRLVPASQRDFSFGSPREVRISVEVPAGEVLTYVLEIKHPTGAPILLANTHLQEINQWRYEFNSKENILFLTTGLIAGFSMIMMVYNLFVFLFSRDKIYLYYSLYILFPMVYLLTRFGTFNNTFIGEYHLVYFYARSLIPPVTMAVYLQFIRLFLSMPEYYPSWNKWFKGLMWAEGGCVLFVLIAVPTLNEKLFSYPNMLVQLIVQISTVVLLVRILFKRSGNRMAFYLTMGTLVFFSGAIFYMVVAVTKVLPLEYGMIGLAVGIACELTAYSLGLGYRIRKMAKEKRLAQEETAKLLANQNKVLEEKVQERTFAIEQQKEEILTQNEELQQQHEEIVTQRDYIAKQHEELSHKNDEITASIRYAQTIQDALLPLEEKLRAAFHAELFVIYRPKDIVSGDFYWYEEVDGKKFLAVADCTGHGVPGAFMGMIGFSILNDEIVKAKNHDPAIILEKMHANVRRILKQDEDNGNQDGMDISLCKLEEQTDGGYIVTCCGAKRPLYYLAPHHDELQQIKGNRISIGGYRNEDKEFTNQQVVLPRGSVMYLCSDGWADQHNPKGKKFGSLRLRGLLGRVHQLPMEGQKSTLEEVLDLHQASQYQRDDITLLGVRL